MFLRQAQHTHYLSTVKLRASDLDIDRIPRIQFELLGNSVRPSTSI